jgi:hypothetical protein
MYEYNARNHNTNDTMEGLGDFLGKLAMQLINDNMIT